MFGIAFEKVAGLFRHALTFGAGYLVAQGMIDEAASTELVAAVMAIIGILWSWREKTRIAEAAAEAAKKAAKEAEANKPAA
jgi:hypothetical protein